MSVVPRQPFAVLDSPRLAHLSSSKNRQNGVSLSPSFNKPPKTTTTTTSTAPNILTTPSKRRFNPTPSLSNYEEPSDSGNAPPPPSPLKRAKFSLTPTPSTPKPHLVASAVPNRLLHHHQPTTITTPTRANSSSPRRAPLTAPAGRSPPRKAAAFTGPHSRRRVSAPFTRIDPPFSSLSRRGGASTALPFSLDAALSATLSAPCPPAAAEKTKGSGFGSLGRESLVFEIYEDSAEEEAATLMEHSTLILDLSGDDDDGGVEAAQRKKQADRGKENVAPGEALDLAASVSAAVAATATPPAVVARRKVVQRDEMDDGARAPLSDLETEDFFAEGLSAESVVFVGGAEKGVSALFGRRDVLVEKEGEVEAQIFVFEDEVKGAVEEEEEEQGGVVVVVGEKRKRGVEIV